LGSGGQETPVEENDLVPEPDDAGMEIAVDDGGRILLQARGERAHVVMQPCDATREVILRPVTLAMLGELVTKRIR
jgi:hypothetical protein